MPHRKLILKRIRDALHTIIVAVAELEVEDEKPSRPATVLRLIRCKPPDEEGGKIKKGGED